MEDQVEVIKSNKGGMKVIHKGYMYTVHKKRQCGGIRWRCAQRSLHCKGSISTGTDGPPKINMPHNHLPDLHSVALARGRQSDDMGGFSQLLDLKFEEDADSMPLQERLVKNTPDQQPSMTSSGQVLKSQSLSPTKLKVTRHTNNPKAAIRQVEPPPSPVNEEMCLRWNSHHSNMQTAFPSILVKEQYVDCTLAAEGKTLKCHRLILSSCSPYFEEILSGVSPFQHPVLFMRDIPFWILKSLCDFMYAGEVHIFQNKLEELLTVAEALKIKGLAGKSTPPENSEETNNKNGTIREGTKKQQQQQQQHIQQPERRNHPPSYETSTQDYDNEDLLDPLDLLEPLYEEATEERKPSTSMLKPREVKYQQQYVKKGVPKKIKKRKFSEQQREPFVADEPSQFLSPPPVFHFRKGTRSRPNVKIPKYYHTDYANVLKPVPTQTDPLLEVDEIKTEPIDVEDNLIDYSDDDHQYAEPPGNETIDSNCGGGIIITNTRPANDLGKFKKIKLSKPIISEVHSVEDEPMPPSGGLEVIKITIGNKETDQHEEEKASDNVSLRIEAVTTVVESQISENGPNCVGDEINVAVVPKTEVDGAAVNPEEEVVATETATTRTGIDDAPVIDDGPSLDDGATVIDDVSSSINENVDNGDGAAAVICDDSIDETATVANNNVAAAEDDELSEVDKEDIDIDEMRSSCLDEMLEEELRNSSLDHLEKEAMNVANAITLENQGGSPAAGHGAE